MTAHTPSAAFSAARPAVVERFLIDGMRLDPIQIGDSRLPDRFWDKVTFAEGCWLWTGACNSNGYGNYFHRNSYWNAHRVAFNALVGDIPAGLQIDHLCRVRCCVNPAHLEAVSPRENTLRGNSLSAQKAKQTHCQHGHELEAPRPIGGKLSRRCRYCDRARDAARRPRHVYDRGDGYDARDPDAPLIFCCDGCDAYRETERAYCPSCEEVTGSYMGTGERFGMVMRYSTDPAYAAVLDTERDEKRAECHRFFDVARDEGLRRAGLL